MQEAPSEIIDWKYYLWVHFVCPLRSECWFVDWQIVNDLVVRFRHFQGLVVVDPRVQS